MRSAKKKGAKEFEWRITRIKSSAAAYGGSITPPDAESAIKKANRSICRVGEGPAAALWDCSSLFPASLLLYILGGRPTLAAGLRLTLPH
jgi:hypothetical protein